MQKINLVFIGNLSIALPKIILHFLTSHSKISNKTCPFLIGAIQCETLPLPLPIREAMDFLVIGNVGKTRIHILPFFFY